LSKVTQFYEILSKKKIKATATSLKLE